MTNKTFASLVLSLSIGASAFAPVAASAHGGGMHFGGNLGGMHMTTNTGNQNTSGLNFTKTDTKNIFRDHRDHRDRDWRFSLNRIDHRLIKTVKVRVIDGRTVIIVVLRDHRVLVFPKTTLS